MTLLHQAAQKAVEALTSIADFDQWNWSDRETVRQMKVIARAALESAALQHQEVPGEPVAWLRVDGMKAMPADEKDAWIEAGSEKVCADYTIPLYASPSTTRQQEVGSDDEWKQEAATVLARFIHLSAQPVVEEWAQTASAAIRLLNDPAGLAAAPSTPEEAGGVPVIDEVQESAYQRGKRAGYSEGFRAGRNGVPAGVPMAPDFAGMAREAARLAVAQRVCLEVSELPDRNSPVGWPEAMLVTHEELLTIVVGALTDGVPASDEAQQAAHYRWLRDHPSLSKIVALMARTEPAEWDATIDRERAAAGVPASMAKCDKCADPSWCVGDACKRGFAAHADGVMASADGWVEAGLVCQACAGDAPGGKCSNPKCVGGPIVRELVPAEKDEPSPIPHPLPAQANDGGEHG